MLGHGAIGQFAIGQAGAATAEVITADKWFIPFTDPVRIKPGLKASTQPVIAFHPTPVVSFGWMAALTEPVKQKPRNPAALYPNFFMQPTPSPFVATGWYVPLSEPVRIKPGLKFYLQRDETQSAVFIPNPLTLLEGWFNWLSEPIRIKPALKTPLQSDYTAPPRLLPAPTVLVTLNAKEVNSDMATLAINVINSKPASSARVSLVEIGNGLSPTAVIEQ